MNLRIVDRQTWRRRDVFRHIFGRRQALRVRDGENQRHGACVMLEGNSFKVLSEFPVSSFARTIHATNIEWTAPSGFAGRNRYHVLNPNAKSDRDKYLDENGKPVSNQRGLPAESRSSWAYIKVKSNDTFHEMRIYDDDHYLIKEIGYHGESKLNNGNFEEPFLHVHDYSRDFKRTTRRIMDDEYNLYKKYFKGLPDNVKR